MARIDSAYEPGRNYQIDFLKFVFSIFVLISHTSVFINENTSINVLYCSYLGWIGVWFFFVVSGLLMVESVTRRCITPDDAGKKSLEYVVNKFKGIIVPYLIAEAILVVVLRIIILKENAFRVLLKAIPDMLCITAAGIKIGYNGPTWYISAMLISMLFLCYLLIAKRDFFLYVFSPLASVLLLGFMYMQESPLIEHNARFGFLAGSIIRAVAGLCSGVCAWLIYQRITENEPTAKQRIGLTVLETAGWLVFIACNAMQLNRDIQLLFVTMIYLPGLIAVSFSRRSSLSRLFRFRWMKGFGKLSLLIYLNHIFAREFIYRFAARNQSYRFYVIRMFILTAILVMVAYTIERSIKGLAFDVLKLREQKNDTKI